jgi:hypothetical protein
MCGIAGWPKTPRDSGAYDVRMTQALYHRGPDAHGVRSWPLATLIHTRLSITGLPPAGEQPIIARLEVHPDSGPQAMPERFPQSRHLPVTACRQRQARKPDTRGGASPSFLVTR